MSTPNLKCNSTLSVYSPLNIISPQYKDNTTYHKSDNTTAKEWRYEHTEGGPLCT